MLLLKWFGIKTYFQNAYNFQITTRQKRNLSYYKFISILFNKNIVVEILGVDNFLKPTPKIFSF
jgi:hypothetical protein